MKYPKYPEYKGSGIEWLSKVPTHWMPTQIKREYSVQLGKMLTNEAKSDSDLLKPYLRAANITWRGVDISDIREMWFASTERDQYSLRVGDLLVSEGGDVGRATLWRGELGECYIQNAVNRIRSKGVHTTTFLYYWIYMLKQVGYIDLICNKSTIAHFTAEKVERTPVILPPPNEQDSIVSFLNQETSQIDGLIAKQNQLLGGLLKKRQALISHTVTKGLDQSVPMQCSGVEWLGEIPAHWKPSRFSYLLTQIQTGWTPDSIQQTAEEDEWAVLKVGCVRDGKFFENEHKALAPGVEPIPELEVHAGDLIMSRANTTELVGSVGLIRQTRPRLTLCDKTFRLVLKENLLPEFANYLLGARVVRNQIELAATGASSSMKNISQESVRGLWIPLPPVSEQQQIVAFLDKESAQIETLSDKVVQTIERLQERRSALITAAVTGQIDVRSTRKDPR